MVVMFQLLGLSLPAATCVCIGEPWLGSRDGSSLRNMSIAASRSMTWSPLAIELAPCCLGQDIRHGTAGVEGGLPPRALVLFETRSSEFAEIHSLPACDKEISSLLITSAGFFCLDDFDSLPVWCHRGLRSLIFCLILFVFAVAMGLYAPLALVFFVSLTPAAPFCGYRIGPTGGPVGGVSSCRPEADCFSLPLGLGYKSYLPSSSLFG